MTMGDAEKITCLHLLAAAGPEALDTCRSQCRAGDSVLLIDSGVLQLLKPELAALLETGCRLYCLVTDLDAHGLSAATESFGAEPVDDFEFPSLLREHAHCLSWT